VGSHAGPSGRGCWVAAGTVDRHLAAVDWLAGLVVDDAQQVADLQ
jgi:hypothetical protein